MLGSGGRGQDHLADRLLTRRPDQVVERRREVDRGSVAARGTSATRFLRGSEVAQAIGPGGCGAATGAAPRLGRQRWSGSSWVTGDERALHERSTATRRRRPLGGRHGGRWSWSAASWIALGVSSTPMPQAPTGPGRRPPGGTTWPPGVAIGRASAGSRGFIGYRAHSGRSPPASTPSAGMLSGQCEAISFFAR